MQAGIGAAASLGRPSPSVAIVCRTTLDAMWLAQDAADSRTEMDTRQQRAYLSSYDRPRRSRNTARRLQQAEPRRVRVRSQFPIRARTATVGAARGRLARRQRQRPLSQVRSSECELRVSCQTGACASCARRQWPPQQQVAATAQLREQLPPRAAPCAATFKSIFAFTFATGPTAAAAASAGRDAASERRTASLSLTQSPSLLPLPATPTGQPLGHSKNSAEDDSTQAAAAATPRTTWATRAPPAPKVTTVPLMITFRALTFARSEPLCWPLSSPLPASARQSSSGQRRPPEVVRATARFLRANSLCFR